MWRPTNIKTIKNYLRELKSLDTNLQYTLSESEDYFAVFVDEAFYNTNQTRINEMAKKIIKNKKTKPIICFTTGEFCEPLHPKKNYRAM
ncbi:MAG: hypothetical protein ACRCZB_05490 [Bacteroidales bacterium]